MLLIDNHNNTNPFVNLAIEDYMVRNADTHNEDYLFLYINDPCVVLGKNQSIYKEVNFDFLRSNELKMCRRVSGGGTVYQDAGNLNFAFIQKFEDTKVNNYRHFNQPLVDALKQAGIEAGMDERNNIICNGKKISGNAQFTNRKNIISHGTLLIDADLKTLRACLKQNDFEIESKAVGSVPGSVMNIGEVSTRFNSVPALIDYLKTELKVNGSFEFSGREWSKIEQLAVTKFQSFEWVYGRSPKTVVKKNGMEIEVEDGVITEIKAGDIFSKKLKGVKYLYNDLKNKAGDLVLLYF